jgi:hypothetical protein
MEVGDAVGSAHPVHLQRRAEPELGGLPVGCRQVGEMVRRAIQCQRP